MRPGLALAIVVSCALVLFAVENSKPKIVHQGSFTVVGIEMRTSNAKEASDGAIGKQWEKFFQQGIQDKIPNQVGGNLYAVYSDYASDRNGEYSITIGAKVSNGSIAPAGFSLKTIPSGNYAVVTSEAGPVAKVVQAAWRRVWDLEDKHELGGKRAYRVDFEVYDQRATDPQNSQVDLFIGLK